MILVDTSVWIELLNWPRRQLLRSDLLGEFATAGPIVQEVFQGLRDTSAAEEFRRNFSAIPRLSDPLPEARFVEGADIYRQGRRRGLTIRSSMDCLIAAIAIANAVPVWHRDRDFRTIALYTDLRTLEFPAE
jgi:predicted nucleic acid-binding protein